MGDVTKSLTELLPGLLVSLQLTAASVLLGLPLGFVTGLSLASSRRWLRITATIIVELIRGVPALLTLYVIYFGLAGVVTIDAFPALVIAIGITGASFLAEIFRTAIQSVPRGQRDAADALGLSRLRTAGLIIVPHVVRVTVAPVIGIVILVFQGTSLAYAVGVKELLGAAFSLGMEQYNLLPELILASVIYLVVTSLLAGVEHLAERRATRLSGSSEPLSRRRRIAFAATPRP